MLILFLSFLTPDEIMTNPIYLNLFNFSHWFYITMKYILLLYFYKIEKSLRNSVFS